MSFISGKMKPGLVPGPIALSIGESVAKKNIPNEALGDGSYSLGVGSADKDQYPNTPMKPGKDRPSLPNHAIPPSPLSTHSVMSSNRL